MSWFFGSKSLLSKSYGSEAEILVIAGGETKYFAVDTISHLDSVYGVFATFIGTRYGVNDVEITLQDATTPNAPDAAWTDVDGAVKFGTAGSGTVGSPTAIHLIAPMAPATGSTIKPYVRFKIVAGASSGATFTSIYRTIRGLK